MKTKRAPRKKALAMPEVLPAVPVNPEAVMAEIGALYRERLRAHYNNDLPALEKINQQIDALKAKL